MTVLIVDDSPDMVALLLMLFHRAGLHVRGAANAEIALSILRSDSSITGLLSDFSMPGMNGVELAFAAKNLFPALRVVVMTGTVDLVLEPSLAAVIERIVQKPFDVDSVTELFADAPVTARHG